MDLRLWFLLKQKIRLLLKTIGMYVCRKFPADIIPEKAKGDRPQISEFKSGTQERLTLSKKKSPFPDEDFISNHDISDFRCENRKVLRKEDGEKVKKKF